MNYYFIAAGILAFAIGLIHSLFGERLVFARMRSSGLIPTEGGQRLREHHVRILWATWHIVTVMGWAMGAMLFRLALAPSAVADHNFFAIAIGVSAFGSSMLVLVGTKGRHPGWIGLLGMAIFTAMGMSG